jgi:RHS repeat-associated protein
MVQPWLLAGRRTRPFRRPWRTTLCESALCKPITKNLAAQTAEQVVIRRSTYSLTGQVIAVRVSGDPAGNNGLHYVFSDHLGSASVVTDAGGNVQGGVQRFYPFGGTRSAGGFDAITDRGFTGHKHNDSLGLIYMNARYYVPYINRFISADTLVPNPENPQSFNRYSYGYNNPLKYIDPSGHDVCPADLSERECSSEDNVDYITESPTHNPLFTIIHIPIEPVGSNDPRVARAECVKHNETLF